MTRTVPAEFKAIFTPAKDSSLNAFITSIVTSQPGAAITKKKSIQQALPRNCRLIAVKDNIVSTQFRTTCASGMLQQHNSPFEASIVQRISNAGATVVGKTNLDEFGMGSHNTNTFFGSVKNQASCLPYSPGGSSGGSAVAVASQQCEIAIGTDTGGSVRLPAAYTGIVGFKPSYGTISRWGVVPYANSLDTVGILGPTSHLVEVTTGFFRKHDPLDPTSVTQSSRVRIKDNNIADSRNDFLRRTAELNVKVGVPVEYNIEELDPIIRRAWHHTLNILEHAGCTIVPVSLPNTKHALSAYYTIAAAEAASNLSKYDGIRYGSRCSSRDGAGDVLFSKTRGEFFGDEVKRRILLGSYTLSSKAIDNYFIQAQKVRRLVQKDFDRVFALSNPLRPAQQFDLSDLDESIELDSKLGPTQVDFIICPTAPTLAPTLDDVAKQDSVDAYMNDVFTVPASLAGIPALSVPFELPTEYQQHDIPPFAGMQILGQYGDDSNVLKFGGILEGLLLKSTSSFPPDAPAGEKVIIDRSGDQSKIMLPEFGELENGSRHFKRKVLHFRQAKMSLFAERTQVKSALPIGEQTRISTPIGSTPNVTLRRWISRSETVKSPWPGKLENIADSGDFEGHSSPRRNRLVRAHYADSAISYVYVPDSKTDGGIEGSKPSTVEAQPGHITISYVRSPSRYRGWVSYPVIKKYLASAGESHRSDSVMQASRSMKMDVRRRSRRIGKTQTAIRTYPSISEVDRDALISLGQLKPGEDWPVQVQRTGEQFRDSELLFRARRRLFLARGRGSHSTGTSTGRKRWFERPPPRMSQINRNIKRGSQKRLDLEPVGVKFSVAGTQVKIRTHVSGKGDLRTREPRTEKEVEAALEDSFASWDKLMASSDSEKGAPIESPHKH